MKAWAVSTPDIQCISNLSHTLDNVPHNNVYLWLVDYKKFNLCSFSLDAGVALSVLCLTTDWTTGVRSPTEAEDFSSTLYVQTGSGAHTASCPMGTGGPFPGGKARPGRDADHSPPSSAEVKCE
jgi:hypothetical protein